jgi:hypothetical protein
MKEIEEWKNIIGFDTQYEISNFGRVRSKNRYVNITEKKQRFYKSKILKQTTQRNGYKCIGLHLNKYVKIFLIHRLVADMFILNKEKKTQINHIDGNKNNNNVSNLEWCTCSENNLHRTRTLRYNICEAHHNAKLTQKQVDYIREIKKIADENKIRNWGCGKLAKEFNVSYGAISRIVNNRRWNN